MLSRVAVAWQQIRSPLATREDRNIRRLMVQTALVGIVQGGIVTFLPVFLVRLGASAVTVSLLTSLPALVTIVLALPAGALASRWRNMVRMSAAFFWALRFCYLLVGAAALLDPGNAPLLIVAIWGLSAVPSTLGNAVFYDILADAVPPRRRPMVNGVRWALLGLVLAVSVALFGQILELLPFPGNYLLVFAASFVAGMLSTWFYSLIDIPLRQPPPRPGSLPWRARAAEFLQPLTEGGEFITFSAVTFVLRVGLFLPAGLYSVFWVRNLQASDAWIGLRATVESVALTAGYYFWGRLASRRGWPPVLVAAGVGVGICPVLTGLATRERLSMLLGVALLGGFFASGFDVSLFEWLLKTMPADRRPRFVAMNTALANLVAFVGPIVGAAVAERIGIPPVLFASGACLFASAGLAYWVRPKTQRHQDTKEIAVRC